jgi:hypothetical protein
MFNWRCKIEFLYPVLLITSFIGFSQDIIQLKNGKIVRGEIISNQNGLVILKNNNKSDSISTSDIEKIFNDEKKEFTRQLSNLSYSYSSNSENKKPKEDKNVKKKQYKNYLGIENDKFAYLWASLSYERRLDKNGKLSLRFPLYFGRTSVGNNHLITRFEIRKYQSEYAYGIHSNLETVVNGLIGMTGVHFHYYLKGNFEKYFTGLYSNFGLFAYRLNHYEKFIYLIDYAGYPKYIEEIKLISSDVHKDGKHFSFGLINGYLFPSNSRLYFSFAAYTGLGFNKIPYSPTKVFFHIQGMLKVGLKF